jgi:ribosomal protein L18E
LQQQSTDEKKNRNRAERQLERLKTMLSASEAACDDLKRKHETRLAQNKKLRAEVSVLKLKETGAVAAALTSSKILDDASKTAIRTKVELSG